MARNTNAKKAPAQFEDDHMDAIDRLHFIKALIGCVDKHLDTLLFETRIQAQIKEVGGQ